MEKENYDNLTLENYDASIYIYIYKLNNKIYFKTNKTENPVKITGDSVRNLKEIICFPIKINFTAISRTQMKKILSYLKSEDIKAFRKQNKEPTNKLQCFDVLLISEEELKNISNQKKKVK